MPFVVNVDRTSNTKFECILILTSRRSVQTYTLNFENWALSGTWLEYIENNNASIDKNVILCNDDNFDDWIEKVTKVNFGGEGSSFGLTAPRKHLCFYFMSPDRAAIFMKDNIEFHEQK